MSETLVPTLHFRWLIRRYSVPLYAATPSITEEKIVRVLQQCFIRPGTDVQIWNDIPSVIE